MSAAEREYRRAPAADFVLAFDLPDAGLRGRLVRLDAASTRALEAHPLPEPAARVAAEACVLGTLLGSTLKLDGRLTVQTKSAGPLDLVAADYYGAEQDRPAGIRRVDMDRCHIAGVVDRHRAAHRAGDLQPPAEPRIGQQKLLALGKFDR